MCQMKCRQITRSRHVDQSQSDDLITIDDACRVVGGTRPISRATYYRHANAGRYPKPVHPTPGISRIRRSKLLDAVREETERAQAEA
jgi:predicted DNA-binding transcriptional regulator AlpA